MRLLHCLLLLLAATANVYAGRLSNLLMAKNITTLACQGSKENIMCGQYEGIRINEAFWGRDNKVDCQVEDPLSYQTDTQMCAPLDRDFAYRKLADVCQGLQFCELQGTALFFDTELCPHIRKYARVKYECRHMSGMKKSEMAKVDNVAHQSIWQQDSDTVQSIRPQGFDAVQSEQPSEDYFGTSDLIGEENLDMVGSKRTMNTTTTNKKETRKQRLRKLRKNKHRKKRRRAKHSHLF